MYREITVITTTDCADIVADALWSIGVAGVEISDPRDVIEVLTSSTNWDYVDDDVVAEGDVVTVKGFIECEDIDGTLNDFRGIIKLSLGIELPITVNDIEERDWENGWKDYYSPIKAGKFTIVPEWLETTAEDEPVVKINPATAFGTGAHESTRLCLMLLSETDIAGKTVLDVGTGSGILGIAAAKVGAKEVFMTDIDPEAVRAAEENLELNGISRGVSVACADLLDGLDVKSDVVTANLTADILGVLAHGIREHIERGGTLICSGIIESRRDEVIDTYVSLGFNLKKAENIGEWWGLSFTID